MKVNFFKSVHNPSPAAEYKPSIVSKLRNRVLVAGIIGGIVFGAIPHYSQPRTVSSSGEKKVEVVVHGVPIITLLGWSAGGMFEEQFSKIAENGFKSNNSVPLKALVTEKEIKCVPKYIKNQIGMIEIFLNNIFENLPRTLNRLGLTAVPQEEVKRKLGELEIVVFSPEKWSETYGEDSGAAGYYGDKRIKIKLSGKDVDESVAAPALYDTLLHEILHHLAGGVEGQTHKSKVLHETLTAIITAQIRLKTANIPTSMTLQPNEASALKEGEKDNCNVGWWGDESFPSYPLLAANDEIQEWIARVGFKVVLNAYLTGDFAEVEKKTNAIFGEGAFKNFFPVPDADTDLLADSALEEVSKRISRDILQTAKKLPCSIEEVTDKGVETDECE